MARPAAFDGGPGRGRLLDGSSASHPPEATGRQTHPAAADPRRRLEDGLTAHPIVERRIIMSGSTARKGNRVRQAVNGTS